MQEDSPNEIRFNLMYMYRDPRVDVDSTDERDIGINQRLSQWREDNVIRKHPMIPLIMSLLKAKARDC